MGAITGMARGGPRLAMTFTKRAFDLSCSAVGLGAMWPMFVLIAILIKADAAGPVFFRQERVGYRGRVFRMWKFRTMVVNAEKQGPALTVERDPRITRVGSWLRRFKLDELPQLFNVLSGDMSLVGPRPEVARYVALYSPVQRRVLDLMPGITDPASIAYGNEGELLAESPDVERMYVERLMPEKIQLNLQYAASATVWSDVLVILGTLAMARGGAAPIGEAVSVCERTG